jgi:N-acylneuraminate cytidylyltransferase
MKTCIAIIPARGGSKRIPGKNIRLFEGLPIISYSIEAALKAGCFSEVMVSTDDSEIARIAIEYGAQVPFYRSAENSGDTSTTSEVILEVLNTYLKKGIVFDYACCIYPTAPFITVEKLQKAFEILQKENASTVLPAVRFSYPIFRALKKENQKLDFFWPEYRSARSQDLPEAFHDAGQFYFINVPHFLKNPQIFNSNTLAIEVPEQEVQDIDNESDWILAELKFKLMQNK